MKKNIHDTIWFVSIVVAATFIFVFYQDKEFLSQDLGSGSTEDYWLMFDKITEERKYIEEAGAHYSIPVFTPELLDLDGEEIVISGYFLPYSKIDSVIIISRYPNASCFFCGLAGIESVAMVEMRGVSRPFRTDQILRVKGKLQLNSTNVQKLAFVIENALVEEI